jgi:hypothetical protein
MVLPHIPPALTRLRVKPDEPPEGPPAIDGHRPRGSRLPHTDTTVAAVRHLIEQTTLSYSRITAKTGVSAACISRWACDGGWQRPPFAPRPSDMMPTARAGQRLKLRRLAERLRALAERAVRELEEAPRVDIEALVRSLQVLKMARLEARGRHRRRRLPPAMTGQEWRSRDEAIRTALKELQRGGVDIDRTPQEALDLVIDANLPVEKDHPALRERGERGERRR